MITRRNVIKGTIGSMLCGSVSANPFDLPVIDIDPRFPVVVPLRPKDWPTLFDYKYVQGDWPAVSGLALNALGSEYVALRQIPTVETAASIDWKKHLHNTNVMDWAFDSLQTTMENKFFLNEWRLLISEINLIDYISNGVLPKSTHIFLDERTEVSHHNETKLYRSNLLDIGGKIRTLIKDRFHWIDDGGDEVRFALAIEDKKRQVWTEPYSNSIVELDDRYEVSSRVRRGYLSHDTKTTRLILIGKPKDRFWIW